MCNTPPSVALFISQFRLLLFSASLPLPLKDCSNFSLCLYDNTLLSRHPIKRISTSSGLTATPVAAGLIKGVSKCLIQRLMPPRELWDENGEKEDMVGLSVWGVQDIIMPQVSHHKKDMKLTCFPGDMPYQATQSKQKIVWELMLPCCGWWWFGSRLRAA